jgi:hypothetical protein
MENEMARLDGHPDLSEAQNPSVRFVGYFVIVKADGKEPTDVSIHERVFNHGSALTLNDEAVHELNPGSDG